MINDYKAPVVWQKAMKLVEEIYRLVSFLPKEETYGLSDQMRRAVVSIPSNIAEGYDRNSDKELVNFLCIARGSCAELETQILICTRLGYWQEKQTESAFSLLLEVPKCSMPLSKKQPNNHRLSAIGYRLSAISYRRSGVRPTIRRGAV